MKDKFNGNGIQDEPISHHELVNVDVGTSSDYEQLLILNVFVYHFITR